VKFFILIVFHVKVFKILCTFFILCYLFGKILITHKNIMNYHFCKRKVIFGFNVPTYILFLKQYIFYPQISDFPPSIVGEHLSCYAILESPYHSNKMNLFTYIYLWFLKCFITAAGSILHTTVFGLKF